MNNIRHSCSDKLNWEYGIKRKFGLSAFIVIGLIFFTIALLVTFAWMFLTSQSFIQALFWTVQTHTTVGYGTGFPKNADSGILFLSIIWMLVSTVFWVGIVGNLSAKLLDRIHM